MTAAKATSPTTPHRLCLFGGSGHIGAYMGEHMLNRSCNAVTFDNPSTDHRSAVPNRKYVLQGALDARFASRPLAETNIPEDSWKRKLIVASQPAYA